MAKTREELIRDRLKQMTKEKGVKGTQEFLKSKKLKSGKTLQESLAGELTEKKIEGESPVVKDDKGQASTGFLPLKGEEEKKATGIDFEAREKRKEMLKVKQLQGEGKSREEIEKIIREGRQPTQPTEIEEDIKVEEPIETEEAKTLREQVAGIRAGKKTREEELRAEREAAGRGEIEELRAGFREQALQVQEELEAISKGLEAEGGAITKYAAQQIRTAKAAPLREQLESFVRGIELTTANLTELDESIDAILEAKKLDRQDKVIQLSNQIEQSNLSSAEKNRLQTQLGVKTARMDEEDDLQAFKQKEIFKAQLEQAQKDSIAQTGLTPQQNLTYGKILENAEIKDDSVLGKAVKGLVKEGKSEQEINKILSLTTDKEGNYVGDTQFGRREKLRKEFEAKPGVKTFREAALQYQGTIATLGQASGPGDVATVFQFMKALDPTSVVRESEFETAAKSAGVAEQWNAGNIFQKFKNGAILGEKDSKTREAFVKTVQKIFETKKDNYDTLARQMINQALRDGVDPRSVVLDLDEVPGASNLVSADYSLLTDDDLQEIDNLGGYTTASGKKFNIDFNGADQPAGSKDFIKEAEGFRTQAYLDVGGVPTIGYGFTSVGGKPVKMGDTITQKQAEQELQKQIARHSNFKKVVTTTLTPNQQKALASFEYNLGPNIWKTEDAKPIVDLINKGDFKGAGEIMKKFNKADGKFVQGLQNRRNKEAKLLIS